MKQAGGRKAAAIFLCLILLTGCGVRPVDRALTGAAIGAGAGAIGSVWVSGNPFAGILIGGVAGALTGALVPQEYLNLGTPLWRLN